jgi:mono/diheme cytochrome c family protein
MRTMGERGCVNCHGIDGKGGFPLMMTSTVAPDIAYDSLMSEIHHHDGQAEVHEGRYTDETIKRAITEGIDPSGKELDHMMPRWKMTDAELNKLLAYLKEL